MRDFLEEHDYNTLKDTLNYLKQLGFNAIELMPVMEFEGNISWGYNPSFHYVLDNTTDLQMISKHLLMKHMEWA